METNLTSVEELKRLELRFFMAEDDKLSIVLEKIFVDILKMFFEQDVLEARSLDSTEKIQTLVSLCNHIRDRIVTSGYKIKIPMKIILEFMIVEEFDQNIHLNKIIQLYLQEMIYEMLKNALLQKSLNKLEWVGLLFQACMKENITLSFQHRLFFLFIYWIPNVSKDMKSNLAKVGYPSIMTQPNFIEKFITFSGYLLDYYNFMDPITELKTKVNKFRDEVGQKDNDPSNIKFGLSKLNLSDTYKYLQLNLLTFIITAFTMTEQNQENQDQEMTPSEDAKNDATDDVEFPSYSKMAIPILILTSASVINEVNEKSKEAMKAFEKHSDINLVSVWSETMKFYINISKKCIKANLDRFDDQTKKTVLLYARNLKRNVLEYALRCEVTARLPQLLTAINDQGQIRLLGLKFVDHMIHHLNIKNTVNISEINSKTIYTLLTKILAKKGFLTDLERSLAYRSLIDIIVKMPELLKLDNKDPIELVDDCFSEFRACSEAIGPKDDEIYSNWIKLLDKLKTLFLNNPNKEFIIVKMKEQIESIVNKFGIDNDKHTIYVYICLVWVEYLWDNDKPPFDLMYISVILSNANDLKISNIAKHILNPLMQKLTAQKSKQHSLENEEEVKHEIVVMTSHDAINADTHQTSMFIKKASQYPISSIKAFNIGEQLCKTSMLVFMLLGNEEEQSSLQSALEKRLLELFSQDYQAYIQKLYQTLEILESYVDYIYSRTSLSIVSEESNFKFLFRILQTTSNSSERKNAFNILQILITKGKFGGLIGYCKEILLEYNLSSNIEYGLEDHSAISNLTMLLLISGDRSSEILNIYYRLCSDFNKITDYKTANVDKIYNFGYWLSKLAEIINLQLLSDDQKCSDAYDDLIAKFLEIVDNKELEMDLRTTWVEDYFAKLYMYSESYLDHVKYLREQYIEYDQYALHKAIGVSASKLLKEKDLSEYFEDLQKWIVAKETTLICKRASVVHLSMFILNSKLIKEWQDKLAKFQGIFFKFMFDKKDEIQEYASNVLTKLYQLGNAEVKQKLVKDLSKALSGSQNFSQLQEKEDDFELNIEYSPNTEDGKKIKTFKDLCDIATDLGHNELIYQFLSIHRHLNHYKNIKRAANSMHGILMEDEKVRSDLLKTLPKIFLMTYDYNEEIRDTMREVMSVIVPPEKENQIIKEKWDDIIQELLEAVKNINEFRKRLSGLHALADVIEKEEWSKVKPIYETLFVTSFKMIDDPNENVKRAAFLLMKTLKKITLRNGNIYTCTNLTELSEIYFIVLPLILSEKGIQSHLTMVKFYSISLLHDILETSREESVVDKLKVKNSREDRQLIYTYNTRDKMREIMKPFLKDIIVMIIESISEFENEVWNKIEMELASNKDSKSGDLNHYLNDQRIKSSKDSILYDMLSDWKDLLSEEVLDQVIPELIKIIKKGVGISTRAAACNFIIESSIERSELFKLKFAKKVFKNCLDILSNAKGCKESLLKIICRLGGALFRTFTKSFEALQSSLDQINEKLCSNVDKYDELIGYGIDKYWLAYLLIIREAVKNMKDLDLSQDRGVLIEQIIPFIFAIKNNALDDEKKREQLSKLGNEIFKDIFENRISVPVEAYENVIIDHLKKLLDSSNFVIRCNGAIALHDLWQHVDDNSYIQKLKEKGVITLLIDKNFASQHFTKYVECISKILEFGTGGESGKYVRSNSMILEDIVQKLTTKWSSQIIKNDMDVEYRKQIVLLMKTVSIIQHHLIKLDYDTPQDAQHVIESRNAMFEALYGVLKENYDQIEKEEEGIEESKEATIVVQPDQKNKDIRSANKDLFLLHQLIIEALAYSYDDEYLTKQFSLYNSIYFNVSWELRLGILRNVFTLISTINKSKADVSSFVNSNEVFHNFLINLIKFTKENSEKFDINLLYLSKVLKCLINCLPNDSQIFDLIKGSIDTIFDTKIKEDKLNKKREREKGIDEDFTEEGMIKIKVQAEHCLLQEEKQLLTEIMQNYYLMKNTI